MSVATAAYGIVVRDLSRAMRQKSRMLGGIAVLCLLRIVVLDEMIPHVPLPDDAAAVGPLRFDLDDLVRPQPGLRRQVGPAARAVGFLGALGLPRDGENVPIRQWLDVMMEQMICRREFPIPQKFSVPRKFLNSTALSAP